MQPGGGEGHSRTTCAVTSSFLTAQLPCIWSFQHDPNGMLPGLTNLLLPLMLLLVPPFPLLYPSPAALLQDLVGNQCLNGDFRPRRDATLDPTSSTSAVQFSALANLNWKVPVGVNGMAERPTSVNYMNYSNRLSATSPNDFFSVMCNGFGEVVAPNRQSCFQSEQPSQVKGAIHIRYDCANNTMWFLTYAFKDITFGTQLGNLWIRTCDTEANDCRGGGGGKFVQFASTVSGTPTPLDQAANLKCASTCTNAICSTKSGTTTCPWCCNKIWGIVDTDQGGQPTWIGYMVKVNFALPTPPSGITVTRNGLVPHWVSCLLSLFFTLLFFRGSAPLVQSCCPVSRWMHPACALHVAVLLAMQPWPVTPAGSAGLNCVDAPILGFP